MDQELSNFPRRPAHAPGFTLLEMLVVIGIMMILVGAAVPVLNSVIAGSNMERAGQMVSDAIALARQEAVTKNRETQVAFLKYPQDGEAEAWRGIQVWRIDEGPTGPVRKPVSRVYTLPAPLVITEDATLSPLLAHGAALSGGAPVPEKGDVPYKAFRFRANGAVDSSMAGQNYLTIVNLRQTGTPPANYYTLQINPVTGNTSVIRP
jgi:uncharacterized protein (TIGR02596 family)